jgi:hypothetical protein
MNEADPRIGVYGANGRLNKKFLLSTKKVLENIAGLADELQQQFPLGADKAINGVSRVAGYLHTLYHQVFSPFRLFNNNPTDIFSVLFSLHDHCCFASSKSASKHPTP